MILTKEKKYICENIARDSEGELTFAGKNLTSLAKKYGTPLFIFILIKGKGGHAGD